MLCRNIQELRELICLSRLEYRASDSSDIESDGLSDSGACGDIALRGPVHRPAGLDEGHSVTPDSGLSNSLPRFAATSDSDSLENLSSTNRSSERVSSATTEDFAKIFSCVDERQISRWLADTNAAIAELSQWCHSDDQFVDFAHFWLSQLHGSDRDALIRMEHEIFVDRLASAFRTISAEIRPRHVNALSGAVLHEFPRHLLSVGGPRLILSWLDVVTSSKQTERFRRTLSNIHCSTTCHGHSEIALALRAFALVSLVSAFVQFYQRLVDSQVHRPRNDAATSCAPHDGASSNQLSVSQLRICSAIRKGYADVVHFLIKSGRVAANFVDAHQRSLVFLAVVHKSSAVLNFLLTHVVCRDSIDVNHAADNGNVPLHVAASLGDVSCVNALLSARAVNVNVANAHAGGATALHLAIMHGHSAVVQRLLSAGADPHLTVDGRTAHQLADDLQQTELVNLLAADYSRLSLNE